MKIIFFILTLFSFNLFADDHDDVLAAVEKYYEAREVRDFETMVAHESKMGVCSTNSDGSFHKACLKSSVADYEKNFAAGFNSIFYPEAVKLTKDAYVVRFYYEGVVGEDDQPYRTRVTTTWIKENGKWVMRTQHYSSASFGGVHQTVRSDFEEE
tara:strand:- start:2711 stop:3175 length:465 start_codon:yes stop_codon:yes gene_type:complete